MANIMKLAAVLGMTSISAIAVATPVYAQSEQKREYRIDAQSLAKALVELSRQSDTVVTAPAQITRGKTARAVNGNYTARQALAIMLEGSDLRVRAKRNGSFVIERGKAEVGNASVADEGRVRTALRRQEEVETASSSGRGAGVKAGNAPTTTADSVSSSETAAAQIADEIVVTGTNIRGQAPVGATVSVYSRERLEVSGQNSVANFLNTIPSVSTASTQSSFQSEFGSTTVRLRGLPIGTTLVLIDGHRVETSGMQQSRSFFDLNNIPLSTVDRVEVLSGGASAVYGSDAIAGVVNIILKKDVKGGEATVRYGGAEGTHDVSASFALGKGWSSGNVFVVGTYQHTSPLFGYSRAITASNDYTRFGGPNANFASCTPGTVFSTTAANLPGLSSRYAAVPTGLQGQATIAAFQATAGTINQCPLVSATETHIPEATRWGALANGNVELAPWAVVYFNVLYSNTKQAVTTQPQSLAATGPTSQTYTVSAANPFNPFGIPVGIGYSFPDVLLVQRTATDFVRPVIGLRGDLGGTWSYDFSVDGAFDWTDYVYENLGKNDVALRAALNASDRAAALNPFVDGPAATPTQLASIFFSPRQKFAGRRLSANVVVRGSLLNLPAGDLAVAIGGQYAGERTTTNNLSFTTAPLGVTVRKRSISAAFAEMKAPILANRGAELLTLTAAVRFDDYSDFGNTWNPQLGAEFKPLPGLTIRGAYAESFQAPSLASLYLPRTTNTNSIVTDPRDGSRVQITAISGGNPALRPIIGKSKTIGASWAPAFAQGLRFSANAWWIKQTDTVQPLSTTVILNNESSFPGRVLRDPTTGRILSINSTRVNFGKIDVAGRDYDIAYRLATSIGIWNFSASATETFRYRSQLVPGGVVSDQVSVASNTTNWAPRWKGASTIGWSQDGASASVSGRYVGKYRDYNGTRTIGDFALFDANVRLPVGRLLGLRSRGLKETYLEAGAVNLFNRLPQYSSYSDNLLGYDPFQGDLRGRYLYATIGAKF